MKLVSDISLAVLAFVSLGTCVSGAVLAEWDTTGFEGTETSIPSVSAAAGVSITPIDLGSELSSTAGAGGMNTTSWSGDIGATSGNYYGFTVTVASGFEVQLDTFLFTARSSNTGPGRFGLYYSGTSFATTLDTFTTSGDSYGDVSMDLSPVGTLGVGSYEFRIGITEDLQSDGVGTIGSTGTHRIMNPGSTGSTVGTNPITLDGTVSAIPEPTSALFGGFALLALLHRRR